MFSELIPFYPEWNFVWFLKINSDWSGPILDFILPWLRNKYFWLPLYAFIVSYLAINYNKKGWIIIIACLMNFGMSDSASSHILKPYFAQERPCNNTFFKDHVVSRVKCGVGKSFPSSHATNHFALGTFLGLIFLKRTKWVLALGIAWAAVISYAQVYVGVHYPVDIIVGSILGVLIAFLNALWVNRFFPL